MSLRPVSAFSTCSQGRLPVCRTSQLIFCWATHRCSSSLAQASSTRHSRTFENPGTIKVKSSAENDAENRQNSAKASWRSSRIYDSLPQYEAINFSDVNAEDFQNPGPNALRDVAAPVNLPIRKEPVTSGTHGKFHAKPIRTKPDGDTENAPIPANYHQWEELHDNFLEVRRKQPDSTAEVFSEQRALAKRFLGDISQTGVASLEWQCKLLALKEEDRNWLLPHILIGSLAESAAQSLFVLSQIRAIPYGFRIRMNCLRAISIMYWKNLQQDADLKLAYEGLIEQLRSDESWPQDKLPTVLLQNLLFWSTPEQCETIISTFLNKYTNAEEDSIVAIIDHYVRIGDPERAYDYLGRLPPHALCQPNAIVRGLRDRLLKLDVVLKGENGTNFKYLPKLLALGIPPDEELHNTVIESAILNNMPDVAWDLYLHLQRSHFQISGRSYLVLLRDAFQRGDLQRVDTIMTAIHQRDDLMGDQYLVAYSMNIIRNICCWDKKLSPHEARSHVMALYDHAYDRSPLVRLGLAEPVASIRALRDPSPTLLAFTIWTLILVQRSERDVLRLWQWIKHCIANNDEAIVSAAQFDVIYNGLMLFFSRKSSTLFRAVEVMQYMMSSKSCQPTSRTWSVLLCGFLRRDQVQQAEVVMAQMKREGHDVMEINERYSRYMPVGYDLHSMALKLKQGEEEKHMPDQIESIMERFGSLREEWKSAAP